MSLQSRITSPAIFIFLSMLGLLALSLCGQAEPFDGYTLYCLNNARATYLVDMNNANVHTWNHNRNGGYSAYLLDNGHVIRSAQINNATFNGGGSEGAVQKVNWNGTLVWEFIYSNNQHQSHHDIEPMPNGNVLMIAWEMRTAAQAVQAGCSRNSQIWPDHIIEVQPTGTNSGSIVWEWHAWDHLIQDFNSARDNYGVVADHPELLDINMGGGGVGPQGGDWMHINGISYNPDLDQIVISSHTLNEIYVIDHSTTTAEAATHTGGLRGRGGDILYRWGNPANYDAPGTAYFRVVHCSIWIPGGYPGAGHIMAFNNREGQGTSIVAEMVPPYDDQNNYVFNPGSAYGPAAPVWSYTAPGFYTNPLGGCQRLPNGNTIIVESTSGNMFEVNDAGVIQWSYARGGEIVRALRYAANDPRLYPLHPVGSGELVINEFLARNDSLTADQNGEYDAWIELFNNTANAISLRGFYLSDAADTLNKWLFPDTSVAGSGYLIIWADHDLEQNGLHANFESPANGGVILLSAPNHTVLDSIHFGTQSSNRSTGRFPNGTGAFVEMPPSFAVQNTNDSPNSIVQTNLLPDQTRLLPNYPNPFNPSTTLSFQLTSQTDVTLTVYNILGESVCTLLHGPMAAGYHNLVWNGTDAKGSHLNSGIYFCTLVAGNKSHTQKIILLK